MTFKVVVFTDENVVAIVPSSWLDGISCCLWPPYASSIKCRKAVQKEEEARDDWKSFPIRVLGEAGLYITVYVCILLHISRHLLINLRSPRDYVGLPFFHSFVRSRLVR